MSPDKIFLTVNGRRTSLAELIKRPEAATDVWVENCPGLTPGGKDSRGYQFIGVKIRGQWRIIAGCRNFSLADARSHWGRDGLRGRPDCLALVELIAAYAEKIDAASKS